LLRLWADLARLRRLWIDFGLAARRQGTSRAALTRRAWRLRREAGFWPREALSEGLLDARLPDAAISGRIAKRRLKAAQRRVNPRSLACLTEDKVVFYPYCVALGLKVPRLFAVFATPAGFTAAGEPLSGLEAWTRAFDSLPSEFVVKPAGGVFGRGVNMFRRSGEGYLDARGTLYSAAGLHVWMSSAGASDRLVIQERISCHPDLDRLSGTSALQTLRLVTYVEPDGRVEVYEAVFKIIVGDGLVDNFRHGQIGNMFARVRLEDGALCPAVGAAADGLGTVSHVNHPRTGLALSGFRLPGFAEALDLVRRAAVLFQPLSTIGWDVALTAEGPVLMEGNAWWGPFNGIAFPVPEGYVPREGMARLLRHLSA
jgi:hypothetical protein